MPNRIHRTGNSTAYKRLCEYVRDNHIIKWMADYLKQLYQGSHCTTCGAPSSSSGDSSLCSCGEGKPYKSSQSHICHRSTKRTCNCPSGVCADDDTTYRYARGPYLAALCPISGCVCTGSSCRDWCESGVDRTKT